MKRALPAALLLSGCVGRTIAQPDIPEGVNWIAVVMTDEDGALVRASGLFPAPGPPIYFEPQEALIVDLIGFSASQIGSPSLDDAALVKALAEGDLRPPSTGCEVILPEPSWSGRLLRDLVESPSPTEFSELQLTAPGLAGVCPNLSELGDELLVDNRCAPRPCGATVQSGCSVSIDMDVCDFPAPELNLTVLATGELCLEKPMTSNFVCEVSQSDWAGRRGKIDCAMEDTSSQCDLWVVAPRPDPLPLEIQKTQVLAAARIEPTINPPWLDHGFLHQGYLFDIELLEDRIVVSGSTQAATSPNFGCDEHGRPARSTVWTFDPESLNELSETTAPRCLTHMTQRPDRPDAIFGTFIEDSGQFALGELDLQGNLVRTSANLFDGISNDEFVISGLEWLNDSQVFVVALSEAYPEGLLGPRLGLLLIASDWTSADWIEIVGTEGQGQIASFLAIDGNTVIFSQTLGDIIFMYDVELKRLSESLRRDRGETKALNVSYSPEKRRVITAFGGLFARMETLNVRGTAFIDGTSIDGPFFEVPQGQPSVSRTLSPDLELVALSTPARGWQSFLAMFDSAEAYFLPGTMELLGGPISEMRKDSRGRFFVISPWTGELGRVTVLP